MQTAFVSYKNSHIHYLLFGKGEKTLLCLHGFAESAQSFASLAEYIGGQYTVVLMDMPLHGATKWNEDLTFTIDALAEITGKIPAIGNKPFSLMGYSMGGRIALQLYQHMPERISKLILIAPDGIIINFWYGLATQTKVGNRLFYHVMKKPGIFFGVTQMLNKISLINTGVYKYVHQSLKTADMRSRLYNIWTIMRKMKPDIPLIKKLIITHKIPVVLMYGRYDKVIRYTTGEKFRSGIETRCKLQVLDCGHRMLHEKNTAAIAAEL